MKTTYFQFQKYINTENETEYTSENDTLDLDQFDKLVVEYPPFSLLYLEHLSLPIIMKEFLHYNLSTFS